MSLSNRFGFGRGRGALPDDSAIFLTKDAAGHDAHAGLKSPQVRTIHSASNVAAPAPADDTPYPSRADAEPLSLADKVRLLLEEWNLAERLFGPVRAAASSLRPKLDFRFKLRPRPTPGRKPKPEPRPAPAAAAPQHEPDVEPKAAPRPAPKPAPRPEPKAPPKPRREPAPRFEPVPPPPAVAAKRRRMDRGDLTLGALGIALGLVCALFPWYIFFNQDKFGVREFVFEGDRGATPPSSIAYQPPLVGQHFQTGEAPKMDLDFFPTATLPNEDERARPVPASEQPFPSDLVSFRLVHVANGRAMIQDGDGLWIVQPGSRLPDASQVASIEQRQGKWVLVTTLDKVVPLTP